MAQAPENADQKWPQHGWLELAVNVRPTGPVIAEASIYTGLAAAFGSETLVHGLCIRPIEPPPPAAPETGQIIIGKAPSARMQRWGITGMVKMNDHWRLSDRTGQMNIPHAIGDWIVSEGDD